MLTRMDAEKMPVIVLEAMTTSVRRQNTYQSTTL